MHRAPLSSTSDVPDRNVDLLVRCVVSMSHKRRPARVAPLALITILLVTGLYFVCEYYKVPLWLTVVFAVVLAILCVHRVERAFRPDGWMNVED